MADKPITELFPELMAGFPEGLTWEGARPGTRELKLEKAVKTKVGLQPSQGRMAKQPKGAELEAALERTLRTGKPDPAIAWVNSAMIADLHRRGFLLD